jgi:hypothetical protein
MFTEDKLWRHGNCDYLSLLSKSVKLPWPYSICLIISKINMQWMDENGHISWISYGCLNKNKVTIFLTIFPHNTIMTIRWIRIQCNIRVDNLNQSNDFKKQHYASSEHWMRGTKLTISGNLSLSKRIVRGTRPLSLYASSPVGDWTERRVWATPRQKQTRNLLYTLTLPSMHQELLEIARNC